MSATWLLVIVSPVFAIAAVLTIVSTTALVRARPEDVPKVITAFVTAFGKLVEAAIASTRIMSRIRPEQQPQAGAAPFAPAPGELAAQPTGGLTPGTETPQELA